MANFSQSVQAIDSILYKLRCYKDPQRIRIDCMELLKNIPSLVPRSGPLVRSQSPNPILYLAGTIPILYNNNQYNIPIAIWVVEAYPFAPPSCFVTPTADMIIKPKHRHVDSQGMCYLPYLSSWNPTNCNLLGLVTEMCKVFSQDPPVRSQPAPNSRAPVAVQPPTPTPPQQNMYPPQPAYPQGGPGYPPPSPYGSQPPYPSPVPPFSNQQSGSVPSKSSYPNSSVPFEDPAVVAKRNAVRSATERLQLKLSEFYTNTTLEIDSLMQKNAQLEDKGRNFDIEKSQLELHKGQTDADLESLTQNFDDLTKWLDQNDNSSNVDIDAITEPKDPLSKQLLYLVAEDATIEDSLYYLEKNMISGDLNIDTFLKNVRSLSTEQFTKRATIKKIHEKQRATRA